MPFIQGDSSSIPEEYNSYSKIIDENYLEKGEIGFLTIDESYVESGKSQRGYGSSGRNVHIEVGRYEDMNSGGGKNSWGGKKSWGGKRNVLLDDDTEVLISNSISDTCRIWDTKEMSYTQNGDLSEYIERYPEDTGILLKSGDLAKISIFTPHECIKQIKSSERQFFRIVGKGVSGREDYFTVNPKLEGNKHV